MSTSNTKPVKWLVLFYLAGDLDSPRSMAIWEDLGEILSVGKDPDGNMQVMVQFDSLGNCFRYELESEACELGTVMRSMNWPKVRDKDDLYCEDYRTEPPKVGEQKDPGMTKKEWQALIKARKEWEEEGNARRKKRDELEKQRKEWELAQGSYLALDPNKRYSPVEVLGRINSGSGAELENFIIWGLSQTNADKVALVVAGKDRLDPVLREGEQRRLPQVFTLCRDDSTRDHLSFVEFSQAIRNALRKSQKRAKLDILAIDSAQSQFMELAHELEDCVDVLIGAQTPIPREGWDYRQVLAAWRNVLTEEGISETKDTSAPCNLQRQKPCQSGPADPRTVRVAKRIVEAVGASYENRTAQSDDGKSLYAISALDLTQLPDMTANFDSACMTFMQSLGEGVMWEGREILRDFLEEHLNENQYDCGIFFRGLRLAMQIKSLCPVFDWLLWDLKQHGIGEHNGRFWNHVFDSIETPSPQHPIPQPKEKRLKDGTSFIPVCVVDQEKFIPITLLKNSIGRRWTQDYIRDRSPAAADVGMRRVEQFRKFTTELLSRSIETPSDQIDGILEFLGEQDRWLEKMILRGPGFPSAERWKSFEHINVTRQTLKRLHLQAEGLTRFFPPRARAMKLAEEVRKAEDANTTAEMVVALAEKVASEAKELEDRAKAAGGLGGGEIRAAESKEKALKGVVAARENAEKAAKDLVDARVKSFQEMADPPLVLAAACTDHAKEIWWTGLSLYRPGNLDTLMNREYRDFSFHRKVHWSALLGAIYLIEATPPLAMWRLISSLITRGSGSTRRDLLEHLSGEKSVIWGMENQFRILAPAPVITLTLEHRETVQNRRSRLLRPPKWAGADSGIPVENSADDHIYLVRLESHRQGAVIFEHTSRVRAVTLEGVLTSLGEVLDASTAAERSFARLTSLGGILGDEVLQELARALESEQRSIRNEVRRRNGLRRCIQCGRGDFNAAPANLHCADDDDGREVDVHLQLHMPRELMHHPWELMSIHDRMLGFNFAIGRRVFMDSTSFRGDREREQGTIRLLLVVPRYEGVNYLNEIEREKKEIEDCFNLLAASRGQIVMFKSEEDILAGDEATFLNFRRKLQDGRYDIIHFAGHGQFVADDPEASAWILTDSTITAAEIRNALRNHPAPPWLVYANACKAGLSSRSHSSRYVGEVHGLATAFIGNGVAAYVGPLWDLGDGVARRIAVDFYKELLLQGATLGEALLRAKRRVKNDFEIIQKNKMQGVNREGGKKATDEIQAQGDVSRPSVNERTADAPISIHDISGAGVVLFGDASGELIQALAGMEKISVYESGDSSGDYDDKQKNRNTNQNQ